MKPAITILNTTGVLKSISLHPILPLIVASSHHSIPAPITVSGYETMPCRLSAYLLFFLIEGDSSHNLDMSRVDLKSRQLMFVQPNQIHQFLSDWHQNERWYKIAFDEETLSLLPQSYDFLINPLNNPIVHADQEGQERLIHTFECLVQLLAARPPQPAELVLSYLNVLLSELNTAYFKKNTKFQRPGESLKIFLGFKRLVEKEFTNQPAIQWLAVALSVSGNKLYSVVRQFAGVSPKTYLLNRTMLEAQRMFFYDRPTVKQVAYELGFNDPDHFSRAFKRSSGKTITQFIRSLQDLTS